jgi:hypothetical protein
MRSTSSTSCKTAATSLGNHLGVVFDALTHSPFYCHEEEDGSITVFLNYSTERTVMRKMAQAMPPLIKAARPFTRTEEARIGYQVMDARLKHFVCGHTDVDLPVLSHVFVDEEMAIAAGANDMIVEMHQFF